MVLFFLGWKDVAFSKSAEEYYTIPAYNLPYHVYGLSGEDKVLPAAVCFYVECLNYACQ
jgi:hypothetical protein